MTTRRALAVLGWVILGVCIVNFFVTLTRFAYLGAPLQSNLPMILAFLMFPLVGALIISQRPTNTVGWLFCLFGVGTAITSFSAAYVQVAIHAHTDAQPVTGYMDLAGNLIWPANLVMGLLLLLLFPDGRPLSPRWRIVVWALLAALVSTTMGQVIAPGPLEPHGLVPNPLGVPALARLSNLLMNSVQILLLPFALLAIMSAILRYRRANVDQRQRIKWFVYGGGVMIVFVATGIIGAQVLFSDPTSDAANTFSNFLFALGIVALPIGTGVGVLRYRLYDIDILINRTLVYGSLTAILAALYFGLVIGAQLLTQRLTNHTTGQQPLVIVLSTLLIAALVQPLRRRLQRTIDQRFYRSRYDAAKTLAAFTATLRSEVNLAQLNEHLMRVVEETMRPTSVSLWLRPTPERESQRQPSEARRGVNR